MGRSSRLRTTQVGLLVLLATTCACSRREPGRGTLDEAVARRAQETYARVAYAAYDDSVVAARALLAAVDALLAEPSESTLGAARGAWLRARVPYAQTEAYRFYDGPIDQVELLMNTWPIDENVVEAEGPSASPGIIDDVLTHPDLSASRLVSLNMRDGETSVSTGFHVIEFLLWGRDTNEDGPGSRPALEFAAHDEPKAQRRRGYLRVATALLVEHLERVRDAWSPATGEYRAGFLALGPTEAIGRMIKGIGTLSGPELAGERLTVPYETRDQENEHSCFSDSTRQDFVHNVRGIENVCAGSLLRSSGEKVQGTGLCAALASIDATLARTLEAQIAESLSAVEQIPEPFDRALQGGDDAPGRLAIKRAIVSLEAQAVTLGRAAAALGVGLPSTVNGGI